MSIRIPTNADQNLRDALYDIEQELIRLEEKVNESPEQEIEAEIATIRAEIEELRTRRKTPDYRDVMVGSGSMHASGLTPDPPSGFGSIRFLNEGGIWTSPLIFEEFGAGADATSGSIGANNWYFYTSTGGSTACTAVAVAGHPGIQEILSGTTNAAISVLYHHASVYPFQLADIDTVTIVAALEAKNTRTTIGMMPSVTADNGAGTVSFEVLSADTNWFSVTIDGSGTTRKDTGIAFGANEWHTFMFKHTAATTWEFYIDGVLKTTHTNTPSSQNVPAATTAVQVVGQVKSDGTSRKLYLDLIGAYGATTR